MEKMSHMINKEVYKKTVRLYKQSGSWSRASLAKLRRGIGKELGELPELLEYVLVDLPDDFYEKSKDDIKKAEKAIYQALTLFAFHQQGKDDFMSGSEEEKYGPSLGKAIRLLINKEPDKEIPLKRRFNQILSADNVEEVAVHTRGVVGMLKDKNISLDYARYAKDLYWFQYPEYKKRVALEWSEDYFKLNKKENKGDSSDEKK